MFRRGLHAIAIMSIRTILERLVLRDVNDATVADSMRQRAVLERFRLCDYFYERYSVQHGYCATRMFKCRRHMGQRVKLLQNADADHNVCIRPLLERFLLCDHFYERHHN